MKLFFSFLLSLLLFQLQAQKNTTVLFDSDRFILTADSKEKLTNFVKDIKSISSVKIELYGHCDSAGSPSYNDLLSVRRVEAVYQFLLSQGIADATITVKKGYGENRPINDNATKELRSLNRRVEILLTVDAKEIVPALVVSPTVAPAVEPTVAPAVQPIVVAAVEPNTSTNSPKLTFDTIGTQSWTNKNLDVSTYRNGDIIPQVKDQTEWAALTTGAWCYYNNDSTQYAKYGKIYNWYAVSDPRGLAPIGWHIPTNSEWIIIATYLGADRGGGKMKETGTLNWLSPNTGATNETGFAGLPGGYRNIDGTFYNVGSNGYWWSSSETNIFNGWYNFLDYLNANVGSSFGSKQDGMSVRCLRD